MKQETIEMAQALQALDDPRLPALDALAVLAKRFDQYDTLNRAVKDLQGDFPTIVQCIDADVCGAVMKALDAILGDEIASYYLHEARTMRDGGSIIEATGREWPIRNLDDVRAYVLR